MLELHSDASAWWVLPRNDPYAERELRGVARALDLDELAIKDLLADDRRVKYEEVGQARLVITGAVSVDDARQEILVHPLSIIATDRALICLAGDTEALQPAQLLTGQTEKLAALGIEAALPLVLNAVIASYEDGRGLARSSAATSSPTCCSRSARWTSRSSCSAFRLKRALSELRRLTEPMRTVLDDLIDDLPPASKANRSRSSQTAEPGTLLAEQHPGSPTPPTRSGEALALDLPDQPVAGRRAVQRDHEEADAAGRRSSPCPPWSPDSSG